MTGPTRIWDPVEDEWRYATPAWNNTWTAQNGTWNATETTTITEPWHCDCSICSPEGH